MRLILTIQVILEEMVPAYQAVEFSCSVGKPGGLMFPSFAQLWGGGAVEA